MTGWSNWALNIYPLLCPALNNMYVKMGGKQNREQQVYINNTIQSDLMWAVTHIKKSDGIHLLKSISWDPSTANIVAYCNACPTGLGF